MYRYKKYTPKHMKPKPSRAQRVAVGAMSTVLGISMSIPFGATAALADEVNGQSTEPDATTQEGKSQTAKKEVVYTKTDATGNKSGIYVVNYWNTQAEEEVSDPGTYTQVQNLSTTDALSDEGGAVKVTTTAGAPFYYQGDLDASTQLPWNVSLTYRLDGKVVSPDQLAGQDGDLDIELKVDSLDDDSATSDFAKSFLLQAQGTFNNDNLAMDDTDGATVATSGNNTVLTYLVLPGESGDWHIKGKATDFTYSGWQIAAMPLDLAIDINDYDTSQLTDAAGDLEDGTSQLADGAAALKAGLSQLDDGASSALTGSNKLADGAAQLADGTAQAVSGSASAAAGANQLSSGLSQLQAGTSQLSAGATKLTSKLDGQKNQLETLKSGSQQVYEGTKAVQSTLQEKLPNALRDMKMALYGKDGKGGINGQVSSIKSNVAELEDESTGMPAFKKDAEAALTMSQSASNAIGGLTTSLGQLPDKLNGQQGSIKSAAYTAADQAGTAKTDAGKASGEASAASTAIQAQIDALKTAKDNAQDDATKSSIQSAIDGLEKAKKSAVAAASDAKDAATAAGTAQAYAQGASDGADKVSTEVTTQLNDAQQALKGATALKAQLDKVNSEGEALLTKADSTISKADSALTATDQVMSSAQGQLKELNNASGQIGELVYYAGKVSDGTTNVVDSLTQETYDSNGQATSLLAAAMAIKSGSAQVDQYTTQAANGAAKLASGLDTLSSGSTQLNDGAKQVASGSSQLASGLSTLKDGTGSAYDGSVQLSDGATELADAVSGIDQKVLDEVQDTIDEKLGKNYALHSFVDPSNTNVEEVQFVYVVSGVSTDDSSSDQKASDDSSTQNQSFVDRLTGLFSDDKKDE